MSEPSGASSGHVVVCLPDLPERVFMGDFPANVKVVLVPPEPGDMPDLAGVDLVVPTGRVRPALFEALRSPGRPRVIQTLSAGVDWLIGRVPEGVVVCNARGVYDGPLAEWVVGAILAFQRGFVRARDAQAAGEWTSFELDELAGRRVVILGFGSIGTAVAERLRPFGVEIVGVARTRRDGALGLEDLDAGPARRRRPRRPAAADGRDGRLPGRSPARRSSRTGRSSSTAAAAGRSTRRPSSASSRLAACGLPSTSPIPSRCPPAIRSGPSPTR